MNEKRLDDLLKAYYSGKAELGESLKSQIRRKAQERDERRSMVLLCVVQIAMMLLTVAIALAVYILVSNLLISILIIGMAVGGTICCVVIMIIQSKKADTKRRVQIHE